MWVTQPFFSPLSFQIFLPQFLSMYKYHSFLLYYLSGSLSLFSSKSPPLIKTPISNLSVLPPLLLSSYDSTQLSPLLNNFLFTQVFLSSISFLSLLFLSLQSCHELHSHLSLTSLPLPPCSTRRSHWGDCGQLYLELRNYTHTNRR